MPDFIYVNPEYDDYLRSNGLLNLRTLLNWSKGDCVGDHGARQILRINLPHRPTGETFYLRKDYSVPFRETFSDLVRLRLPRSRCAKTSRAVTWLEATNINTMKIVCLIERRVLGLPIKAAAIVTAVPGDSLYTQLLSFGRLTARLGNPPARRQLLYELGRFVSRFHQARLSWPDFTAKHVHVRYDGRAAPNEGRWRFALIDVENAIMGCSSAQRASQLDKLLLSLRGLLTPTDVLRIMIGYAGVENLNIPTVRRRLLTKFFPRGFQWIARARRECELLKQFPENRLLPEEELYERIGSVSINTRFRKSLEALNLTDGERMLQFRTGSELYKPGLTGRYRYRLEAKDSNDRPLWLYLKRTARPPLSDQLARILSGTVRHSSGWHERNIIKSLGALRIPAPVVVAYGEKMLLGYERASVLITEGIVGQSLERFAVKHFARSAGRDELRTRRTWTRQLAQLIRRLHLAGYCHRDLYFAHIFISFQRGGQPVFYLIDLARCFKMFLRKTRWTVKDLAALDYSSRASITRTDRMRFLRDYLAVDKLNTRHKNLARKILAKSARIARHDQRHRRITVERRYEDSPGN